MSKTTRRQFHQGSLGLAALLSGCGGGGGDAAPAPSLPPPPAPVPAPPPPAPPPPSGTLPSATSLLASLLDFAQTAARNWNHGGHQVPEPFDPNQGHWAYTDTTYEPWLFDRAQSWQLLHAMTADARWAQQAQQDLAYYESRLSASGIFLNKAGEADTKYSYVHAWSTNAAKRQAAFDATVSGWSAASGANAAFFTERELWVALYAAVELQKAGGGEPALARGRALLDQWDRVCAGRGAPLVSYTQHEGGGPGGTQPTDLVSSPWMSALYFQAAREFAELNPAQAPQVRLQASHYFDWLNRADTRGFYPGEQAHPEFTGLVFPAYLAGGTLIGDAGPDEGNADHALDLAGFCAFAIRAKTALGQPTAEAATRYAQMKQTAARAFANWTRTTLTLPRYRLNPPRKFNWWVRGMAELMHHAQG